MVEFIFDESHIEACNKLIEINNFKLRDDKKSITFDEIKRLFTQVSKKQYIKVFNWLKKQIDLRNKKQTGGDRHLPQQKEFDPYGEINENNGLPLNFPNELLLNENFNSNNDENDVPNIVTYRGYTPFQIRVIIIFIFCVIYGILEEFNYIHVPSSIDPDLERHGQPTSPPPGWSSTFRGGKRKKRQTKKHRVKKRNKRKTITKKKTKRN